VIAESKRKRAFLNWRLSLQTTGIYRDPAIPGCKVKVKTGGSAADAASRPGLAPEVSAQVASLQSLTFQFARRRQDPPLARPIVSNAKRNYAEGAESFFDEIAAYFKTHANEYF
jgi:hypothetical protein